MTLSPGDIIEIETDDGLVYAQITHQHVSYPDVVRVFAGTHGNRCDDLQTLVEGEVVFSSMVALSDAMRAGRLRAEKVGSVAIKSTDSAFPNFKMPIRDKRGGIAYWWFWDGDTLRYDADPAAGNNETPAREVLSVGAFLERIDTMHADPAA